MWRLRRPSGWQTRSFLPGARARVRSETSSDCRRPRRKRKPSPAAGCFRRSRCSAMRLLHTGHSGDRQGLAGSQSAPHAGPNPGSNLRQPVPLYRVSSDFRSRRSRDAQDRGPEPFCDVVGAATVERGAGGRMANEKDSGMKPVGARKANGDELRVIGVPRRRVDARAKVTGQTRFADDIFLPRMAHCKLLRSPHPHARIRKIDASRALACPGVYLVLTGKDLPIQYGILPVSQDEQALCVDHVRHVGDPVAAVIAREELTAFEALDLIDVEYEVLKTISNPEEALATREPRIHEYGEEGNIHKLVALEFGNVEEGFAEADEIFEDTFFFQGNTHLPIEQHASVAIKDPDGKLTIWSSTQTPHYLHRALAKVLEMPPAHIRVIATPNGGGFGGKSDPFNHEIVVAKAALMLDRPVKICLTREEVFYCHRGRHPVLMKFKTGVKKDGTITGMHLQTLIDGGAYGSYGVASTYYAGALQTTTYHIPRYRYQGCRTFTNKPPCGPKRGHGTPQPRFGQEVQLDKIAEKLKMDPADLRLRIVES